MNQFDFGNARHCAWLNAISSVIVLAVFLLGASTSGATLAHMMLWSVILIAFDSAIIWGQHWLDKQIGPKSK